MLTIRPQPAASMSGTNSRVTRNGPLRAPVVRVGAAGTPAPYAPNLEQLWLPDRQDIEHAIEKLVRG